MLVEMSIFEIVMRAAALVVLITGISAVLYAIFKPDINEDEE